MSELSAPYFFSFDTKSKPGKLIAHCIRLQTVEMDSAACEAIVSRIMEGK